MNTSPVPRTLLLLHIRKTAGTALRIFLENHFSAAEHLDIPHSTDDDPNGYRFVSGHLTFDYVSRFRNRPILLPTLRDPLERALSAYSYYHDPVQMAWARRLRSTWPDRREVERLNRQFDAVERHDLISLLRDQPAVAQEVLGNVQTRALAGVSPEHPATPEVLQRALTNLRQCDLVWLHDRATVSLSLMFRNLGWESTTALDHYNVTRKRLRATDLSSAVIDALHELTQQDTVLYRAANDLLDQRLAEPPPSPDGLAPVPEPDRPVFTFDQPIHGSGWYQRERDSDGFFRWTGESANLRLFYSGPAPNAVRLQVTHAANWTAVATFRLWLNGHELRPSVSGEQLPTTIEAVIPSEVSDKASSRFELRLQSGATVCPQTLDPNNVDARSLGVAVREVRLVVA